MKTGTVLILNWIAWNKIVMTFNCVKIKTVLILNWIVWNRIVLMFDCVKTKTVFILSWIVWNRTVDIYKNKFWYATKLKENKVFIKMTSFGIKWPKNNW